MLFRLDLHHNAFHYFPRVIKSLKNLEKLNLGGNKLRSIHPGSFDNNPKLKHLILRRNKLESFPSGQLPSGLVKITIGRNLLNSINDLRGLDRLRILRLDSNRFAHIPANQLPPSLRELSMCQNLLTPSSSLSVNNLKNLRRLRLAGNPNLGEIAASTFYTSANRLRDLDLRQSGLSRVSGDAFSCLGRLRAVALEGNRLTRFSSHWFRHNRALRKLTLAGNPWRCSCEFHAAIRSLESGIEGWSEEKSSVLR